jgi:hypothetical protein
MTFMIRSRALRWPARLLGLILSFAISDAWADEAPRVAFAQEADQLRITVGGEPMATYVFRDEKVLRPFFTHACAPGGIEVTRRFPPVEGSDPTDHATMHPGIWLAFGDINGADFWRNKGRVEHERFVAMPEGGPGQGTFIVRNRYVAEPGAAPVCLETCRVTVLARPAGTLLIVDSEFTSDAHALAFGAQEEMGLGVRVATPIAVKQGGRLVNSDGLSGEPQVWGKHADWCDSSGIIGGRSVGVTLMTDPSVFRRGWFHARDYGLMVANPIERTEKKSEPAKLVVPQGEALRLRFGVLLHAGISAHEADLKAAYEDFLRIISMSKGPGTP